MALFRSQPRVSAPHSPAAPRRPPRRPRDVNSARTPPTNPAAGDGRKDELPVPPDALPGLALLARMSRWRDPPEAGAVPGTPQGCGDPARPGRGGPGPARQPLARAGRVLCSFSQLLIDILPATPAHPPLHTHPYPLPLAPPPLPGFTVPAAENSPSPLPLFQNKPDYGKSHFKAGGWE